MESLLLVWVGVVFVLGAVVGSGLNVCIVRIPYEKSILWPGSHCCNCFQRVRWYDNVPLLSYWVLRGRCRTCGVAFSMRYFLIELFTGLVFVGLFYLDVILNLHDIKTFRQNGAGWFIGFGVIPLQAWLFWGGHALLASFLIVMTFTDLDHMEIPLSIPVTGTLVGLVLAMCFPWPWPNDLPEPRLPRGPFLQLLQLARPGGEVVLGFQPWPLWRPDQLPSWLAPGSWQLGLATGLAGVLAGIVILRGVRFLFGLGRGIEGMGLGDADLMMMAGAFLGWQPVVIAFFVSVFPALLFGVAWHIIQRKKRPMPPPPNEVDNEKNLPQQAEPVPFPFGPSLALGTLLTLFGWRWIGPHFQILFFQPIMLLTIAGMGAFFLLLTSFLMRVMRGGVQEGVKEEK
jgi:leader peptidase (prepilin peptidase) / N-methyltransferase